MKINETNLVTEIRGNSFCLIEGIEKLVVYEDGIISVSAKNVTVCVSGSGLTLDCLADDRIGIHGNIVSITYGGKGERRTYNEKSEKDKDTGSD